MAVEVRGRPTDVLPGTALRTAARLSRVVAASVDVERTKAPEVAPTESAPALMVGV